MLDLLIAILIALGCSVDRGQTEDQIKASTGANYEKATEIMNTGNYREKEGGGVVIVEVGGD